MRNLDHIATDVLANALHERMVKDGTITVLPLEVYKFVTAISVMPCVDAFPVRWRGLRIPELGFIRRNTGLYTGMWWCIGGHIHLGESFGYALKRHVRETLGVGCSLAPGLSWNHPAWVAQRMPAPVPLLEGECAEHEPLKHCTSNTYLVELDSEQFTFGNTVHGGQEANEFRWFPTDTLPFEGEIAYGGQETVSVCAKWATENLL